MSRSHLLLIGAPGRTPPEDLPARLERDSEQEITAEIVSAVEIAVTRLSEKGCDAVVCWIESRDKLDGVLRIRKARPKLPILVLTPERDSKFERLARKMGASRVAREDGDLAVISRTIRLAFSMNALSKELEANVRRLQSQTAEIRALSEENQKRVHAARVEIQRKSRTSFIPLLVEHDPEQAILVARAFQKLDIFTPLPVLRDGEEVIAYLSEAPPFEKRNRYPFPSLVMLDLELQRKSGLEVLQWIRKQPSFVRLPVVILSSLTDPMRIYEALKFGANAYHVKPAGFGELVKLIDGFQKYWGTSDPGRAGK